MLELPDGIEVEVDPVEVRYRRNLRGLLKRYKRLYDAIVDRLGDEGLELIRNVSAEYGEEIADRIKEREGKMDLKSMGSFIIKVFNNMRAKGKVSVFNDEEVAIEIHHCPYPIEDRRLCEAHIRMEEVLVEKINPELEFVLDESTTKGDPVCIYRVRKKRI